MDDIWFAAPCAHVSQINGQLARHGHDGFLARCSSGERSFSQDLPPFDHRLVIGLKADQSPSQFHQGSSESGVAVFSHAALQARVAATVLSGAESGVTADLPPVVKPAPITDLSIDDHAGHSAQTARL